MYLYKTFHLVNLAYIIVAPLPGNWTYTTYTHYLAWNGAMPPSTHNQCMEWRHTSIQRAVHTRTPQAYAGWRQIYTQWNTCTSLTWLCMYMYMYIVYMSNPYTCMYILCTCICQTNKEKCFQVVALIACTYIHVCIYQLAITPSHFGRKWSVVCMYMYMYV